MSALYGLEQIDDGVLLVLVFVALIALAVVCAPSTADAPADRPRQTPARHRPLLTPLPGGTRPRLFPSARSSGRR